MKFSSLSIACLAAMGCYDSVTGFSSLGVSVARSRQQNTKSTKLFISSWGAGGSPYKGAAASEKASPKDDILAYLKEPEAVEARNTIDGKCLVSGLTNTKERTDQFLFDLLNDEESAFEFDKIVAFVDNSAFSKKRLLSRSARYTGLLDKLDFVQASTPGALPTVEQLNGVKSWVAVVDAAGESEEAVFAKIKSAAMVAKQASSVQNLSILITNAIGLDATKSHEAIESVKGDDSLAYTLVVVGKLEDRPEGKIAYKYETFGTEEAVLSDDAVFSREESMRMITELLQLESGANKALTFSEVDDVTQPEAKLVKGLREAGYVRMQEIDHMVRVGPKAYTEYIEQWTETNPDEAKGYTTDAWWESEQFKKSLPRNTDEEKKELQLAGEAPLA